MKMKATGMTLALSLIFALLALTACSDDSTDNSEKKATPPPVETPMPTPTQELVPSSTPEPPTPVIEPPTPELPATFMTYEDAMEVCKAWLDARADLSPYFLDDMAEPGYPVPPTFSILGEHYYTFYVTYHMEGGTDYPNVILVNEKTGELLSASLDVNDDDLPIIIMEPLDDWYRGEQVELTPALLTADEALAIYYARVNDLPDDQLFFAETRMDEQPQGKVVILGEQYYCFEAEDDYMYWYNILVHADTGELLFMWIHDGMYGGTDIEPLEDVLERW